MRLFVLIGLLLSLSGNVVSAAPTLLVVGDSLSAAYGMSPQQGWVSLLQQRLSKFEQPHRVVNASVTGDTTRGGLTRLPSALERHTPEIVIIELGGNDGLRALPLAHMESNLRNMVRMSRANGARVLLLGVRIPENYGPAFSEKFRAVYHRVAAEESVPLVPFFLAGVAETRDMMLPDGIHPGPEAQPLILENVWPAVLKLLENI